MRRTDRAVVDAIDVAAACETVEGQGGTPSPPGPGPGPADQPADGPRSERCTVPKVARRARLAATRRRLTRAGCTVKVVRVRSRRVGKGRVVRLSHRRGARAATVKVYVSRGRR